jgi:hypothetical protein
MNTVSLDTATADGELSCAAVGEPPSPQGLVLTIRWVPELKAAHGNRLLEAGRPATAHGGEAAARR